MLGICHVYNYSYYSNYIRHPGLYPLLLVITTSTIRSQKYAADFFILLPPGSHAFRRSVQNCSFRKSTLAHGSRAAWQSRGHESGVPGPVVNGRSRSLSQGNMWQSLDCQASKSSKQQIHATLLHAHFVHAFSFGCFWPDLIPKLLVLHGAPMVRILTGVISHLHQLVPEVLRIFPRRLDGRERRSRRFTGGNFPHVNLK